MATPLPSNVLVNCHPECEAAINYQISLELYASSVFESMAFYFNNHEVGLEHLVQSLLQQSRTEREHAQSLMQLQSQRGGRLHLLSVVSPEPSCWENSFMALECAFHVKMTVNQNLLHLHRLAVEKNDNSLYDFLKGPYWPEQMRFVTELRDHITSLREMRALQSSLAEDLSAKLTLKDGGKKN